ncbi:MAG TPA: hypothetical protein VGF24_14870 [Vicinamibacterales bacterium]|jgi:hypothetical protein
MTRRLGLMVFASLAFALPARAQTTVDPSGHWEGTVDLPNFKLPLAIDIAKGQGSDFTGTLTNTTQGIHGLPLKSVTIDGRLVQFVIASGSGREEFNGVLTADGKTISGSFLVNGLSAPIEFARTGEAVIDHPSSAAIGKEFEGTWNGVLDVNGKSMRFVMTVVNHANGTSTGSVMNLDGGGVEVPVSAIAQKASSLTVEIKAVSGSYTGTLSPDGSTLTGTWTEPSLSAAVTFTRAR